MTTYPPRFFGRALRAISVNLPVAYVGRRVALLQDVPGMTADRVSADLAIMLHAGQPFHLHGDHTYGSRPLLSLLPEACPRGGGIALRLHEGGLDLACAQAALSCRAVTLQLATNAG